MPWGLVSLHDRSVQLSGTGGSAQSGVNDVERSIVSNVGLQPKARITTGYSF